MESRDSLQQEENRKKIEIVRIVAVAPWVPCKERPRSFAILDHLNGNNKVTLVCAAWSGKEEEEAHSLRQNGFDVRFVRMNKPWAAFRAVRALVSGKSLQQAMVEDPKLCGLFRKTIMDVRPTVSFYNVLRSAGLRGQDDTSIKIIDLDEFRSSYYRQVARESTSLLWRMIARIEAPRMEREETEILQSFDAVIVSSPTDLRATGAENLRLVRSPHLMPNVRWKPSGTNEIVFVGRQSYQANVEAIVWFVKEVLPLVTNQVADVKLKIVGADPAKDVLALASSQVEVTGSVPDVSRFYRNANVSIVPVRMATGVQMKLIESMAVGVPTVTTSVCSAQAGVTELDGCAIADNAEEWAHRIVQLLSANNSELEKISMAERKWANQNYSAKGIFDNIDRLINDSGQ